MASLANVTQEKIIETLTRCDEIGVEAFLVASGYADSVRYQIRHGGRRYPSKAILGVAAGLRARDFFGGVAQTVPTLRRLGFQIREGRKVVKNVGLTEILKRIPSHARREFPSLPFEPAAYFASGSNRPGEIRGLASVGQDIGVAVPHLNEEAIRELENLAGSDLQVFVDSGAFSEVEWTPEGFRTVSEITDRDWAKILALYLRLAKSLGSQVWVVAPDRVGDQIETLRRLRQWAPELQEIARNGARVLCPVQKGVLGQSTFFGFALSSTGIDMIPALPCKKAATTVEECARFCEEVRPAHVHLLGLGVRNRNAPAFIDSVGSSSVSLDSNWICANVGRKPRRRLYTRARDIAKSLVSSPPLVAELAMLISFS
jgi:hypothetical protein